MGTGPESTESTNKQVGALLEVFVVFNKNKKKCKSNLEKQKTLKSSKRT